MSNSDQHQYKDRYMLRLPDGMRDRIKAAAEASNRSMNAEIIARLQATFDVSSKAMERRISEPMTDQERVAREIFSVRTTEERLEEIQVLLGEVAKAVRSD